jgi:hypothetical protein
MTRVLMLLFVVASTLAACGARQRPPDQLVLPDTEQGLFRIVSRATPNGSVVADWMIGGDVDSVLGPGDSVGHLIREIWFRFASDPNAPPLRCPAVLPTEPGKWTFDIFSLDGRYVALLQSTGEIHLVPTDRLREYIKDARTPHEVVTGKRHADDPALFFEEPEWTSDATFEVTAVCCGTYWRVTHRIGSETVLGEIKKIVR